MLISILRRVILLTGSLVVVGFALLYIHNLQVPSGLPLFFLALGVPLGLAALGVTGASMVKSDDYLTPPHTRGFYWVSGFLVALIGLGLFGRFYFSDRFASTYLLYFGTAPLIFTIIYTIISWVRLKEAHTQPEDYRAEPSPILAWTAAGFSVFSLLLAGLLLTRVIVLQIQATGSEVQWEARAAATMSDEERTERAREFYNQAKAAGDQYRRAHDLFKQAADKGHVEAMHELALIYTDEGFLHDPEQAVEYFSRAEALGHVESSYRLGRIYRHGEIGIERDPHKAHRHLLAAAERGHLSAQTQIGNIYNRGEGREVNYARAFHWFYQAAEQGDPIAQNDVGIYYINGRGVERNVEAGLQWLQRAAEQGITVAEYNLGRAYYDGELVERDVERAARHFSSLANRNIIFGHLMMGRLHLEGQGVEQDYGKAFTHLATAARRGNPEAEYYAGICLLEGLGTTKDTHAGMGLIENAGRRGVGQAQLKLGNLYLEGSVIAEDLIEGAKWLILASRNGVAEADARLAEIRPRLDDGDWAFASEMANTMMARTQAGQL